MGNKPYFRIFDVCTPVGGDDTVTNWLRVGLAFENKKSGKITIKLSAIPTATEEGKVVLILFDKNEEPGSCESAN